jgi:TRAP-type mannitol/chloroaromatic compound transport system permease small subunit
MNVARWIDRLTGATGLFGAWLVAPLVIFTCYEVGARYLFDAPTIWAFELGYMLTGANFLLGMAYALRESAHIRIEVIYARFPRKLQVLINAITYAFIIVPICGWLSYALFHYAFDAYQYGERSGMSAWNPLIWPLRAVYVISFGMLVLQAVAELIKAVQFLLDKRERPDDETLAGALPTEPGRV